MLKGGESTRESIWSSLPMNWNAKSLNKLMRARIKSIIQKKQNYEKLIASQWWVHMFGFGANPTSPSTIWITRINAFMWWPAPYFVIFFWVQLQQWRLIYHYYSRRISSFLCIHACSQEDKFIINVIIYIRTLTLLPHIVGPNP